MVQTRSNKFQFFSTSVQIYQISTYRTVTVHTSYIGTPLFACSRPQDFLLHFRGCQLQDFVPNAVVALPFANGRLLFFWFPVLLSLRDESHFVTDVVEAIDYRIGRGRDVGYDAGNGLVVAGVHGVGSWPSFVVSDFEVAYVCDCCHDKETEEFYHYYEYLA